MKKFSILFMVLAGVSFFSCKDGKKAEPETVTIDNSADKESEVYAIARGDVHFKDKETTVVFNQYLDVQDALINTDAEQARLASEKLFKYMDDGTVEADEEVRSTAKMMAESNNIEDQRKGFQHISQWMQEVVKDELTEGTLYVQYCPMAFDDTGAAWISSDKKILNPYFGDKMLRCGRVDSELK